MYLRFGAWNVRSLYKSGSLKTVARELRKYKLRVNGCTGGQMGQGRHRTGRGLYIVLLSRECRSSVRDKFFCT
jgi:hypothetical protein